MQELGRTLLLAGALLTAVGALLWLLGGAVPVLGRLPGDIRIERPGFRLYVPLATSLLLSLVLSLLFHLVSRLR